MRKQLLILLILLTGTAGISSASGRDIRDILGTIAKGDSSGNSKVSDVIGAINRVTGNDKLDIDDLVGEWKYAAPAVSFKSDNLLKNAGGMAAASQIEQKIEPYYQKAGFNNMTFAFSEDSTFVMKVKSIKMTGRVETDTDGQFVFVFNAFKKVSLGRMNAYVTRHDRNTVSLTFDASKLITLVDKVSAISGNSTLKATSTLLKSYDGLTVGFKLDKQSEK